MREGWEERKKTKRWRKWRMPGGERREVLVMRTKIR